jgi:hypothetical protein
VIWIELFLLDKQVSSDALLITYLVLFIHHKHHFTLMHPWYSSCAYACNRCTRGRNFARIQQDEPGSSRGVAAWTQSLGGAARSQGARRGGGWVPGSQAVQLCWRQALEHYKPPNLWNTIKYYVIYIVALSYRCWMKTLVALMSHPCPDIVTVNPI